MLKQIIYTLIAALPVSAVINAYRKKYAEKKGLGPDSPDAIIGFTKRVALKGLLLLLCFTTILCFFFTRDSNRELLGAWLKDIEPYAEAIAGFLPGVFTLYFLFLLAVGIFYLTIFLLDGNNTVVEKSRKATFKGFYTGLFIGGATLLAIQLACMSSGSIGFAINLLRNAPSLAIDVLYTSLFLASLLVYVYIVCEAVRWVPKQIAEFSNSRYSGKHYKK